jgi:hypothetical protein
MEPTNYSLKHLNGSKIFWGEMSPCDHLVHIYEEDEIFLDMLAGFVAEGIRAEETVVVVASQTHLNALTNLLESFLIKPHLLKAVGRYIPLNAEEALSKFMVNNWPDKILFEKFISDILVKARKNNRRVRVFGEMVAVLWSHGLQDATIQLEQLWDDFCKKEDFCVFCAYPKKGFTDGVHNSIMNLCNLHSHVVTTTVAPEL